MALLYSFVGEALGNPLRVQLNLFFHKAEYNTLAKKFFSQNEIKNLSFYDSQIINHCNNHPDYNINGGWTCTTGDYPNYSEIKLQNIDAVLNHLQIQKKEYMYYSNFLHKYHLNSIGKDDNRFVEFEDGLEGLRYFETENTSDFVVNSEYLHIKKIDAHWSSYTRDWN
jgi:hypothetical protein